MSNDKESRATDPTALFTEWMKSAMEMWEGMLGAAARGGDPSGAAEGEPKQEGAAFKGHRAWRSGSRVFQILLDSLTEPDNVEAAIQGMDTVPDVMMSMAQQVWESFTRVQQQMTDRASKLGRHSKAYTFEDLDQDLFKTLREIYENEFQKFLNVPQVGLTRFYQERFNRYIDKYNIYQTALGEFLYMFYIPLEKATLVLQEKAEELAEKGEFPDDLREFYNMWIRLLEGHYMTLLKSPEYAEVMTDTIDSLVTYKKAREDMLNDLIKNLPIPTNKEMDALYKDVYVLKKKVNELSKKVEQYREASEEGA